MWNIIKQLTWQWRGVWITTPAVSMLVILLHLAGWLQPGELALFDQYLRWRPSEPHDRRIAIVGIDEDDVQAVGRAIMPDGIYAQLLQKLTAMEPRAIGLDVYRDVPVEPGHQELVRVFESTDNLVGIQKVIGKTAWETVAPPPVLKSKGQVGANDLMLDADQRIRRGFLSVTSAEGESVPSLAIYLAALYLESEGITLQTAEGTNNWWQLGDVVFSPFKANDGGYVRADDGDYQILIDYRGPLGHFETVSMTDILKDRVPPDWGRDRIILIGFVSASFKDILATPYTRKASERMAGVEIHANLTSQIISAVLDGYPLFKTWSEPVKYLWIFLWAGVGATLAWTLRSPDSGQYFSLPRLISFVLAVGILGSITYGAFLQHWWIPVVPPLLALGGSVIAITAYMAHSASTIRRTFGRYLTDEIVAALLENPEGLKLGGERRKITILTSDLRGFTALSERLHPEEVVKVLNFYLGRMADVITQYQGTIDEFMGDGILVLFGAPIPREDDPQRAIACAVAMQLAMKKVNQQIASWGFEPLGMGIGINTGEVVVGNIGSEKRSKYGVVGNQMNLTFRIESYTVDNQIIVSESTLQEAGSTVETKGQRRVHPKGVKSPITIYEISGINGQYNLFLSQAKEIFLSLLEPIPIHYSLLKGTDIILDVYQGTIVRISANEAEVHLHDLTESKLRYIPMPCNIKLNFMGKITKNKSEDIYAKITRLTPETSIFCIHFTSIPPDLKEKINTLYQKLKKSKSE